MTEGGVISMTRAAEELDCYRWTVSDMVRHLRIEPKPMSNGRAKGLTRADVELIRDRMRPSRAS